MHLVLNDGVMAWHCKVSHMTFEMVGDHHQAVCVCVILEMFAWASDIVTTI